MTWPSAHSLTQLSPAELMNWPLTLLHSCTHFSPKTSINSFWQSGTQPTPFEFKNKLKTLQSGTQALPSAFRISFAANFAQFPLHWLFSSLSEISPPSVQLVRQASPAELVISPADEQLVRHAFPAALMISDSSAQLVRHLSFAPGITPQRRSETLEMSTCELCCLEDLSS